MISLWSKSKLLRKSKLAPASVTMHEKRSMRRFGLELKTRVSLKSNSRNRKWTDAMTSNISAAGAFLRIRQPFPIGSRLDFETVLPLRDKNSKVKDALVRTSGVVIRNEEAGMAVCFDNGYEILPFPEPVLH
jgi:hypothetical protein